MRKKSCGNGSKNCVGLRNVMRNGIVIGNPSINQPINKKTETKTTNQTYICNDLNLVHRIPKTQKKNLMIL